MQPKNLEPTKTSRGNFLKIVILILAGEIVFLLPFIIPRVFRPTILNAIGISNFELGTCFSFYGVVAMISYVFGGPLADKFSPRKLISLGLILTGLGGLVLSFSPSYQTLFLLYGYWGFTTIFLLWAALIKATRLWGGKNLQGKAFGLLDGGRGLTSAIVASISVYIFSNLAFAEGPKNFLTIIFISMLSSYSISYFFLKH